MSCTNINFIHWLDTGRHHEQEQASTMSKTSIWIYIHVYVTCIAQIDIIATPIPITHCVLCTRLYYINWALKQHLSLLSNFELNRMINTETYFKVFFVFIIYFDLKFFCFSHIELLTLNTKTTGMTIVTPQPSSPTHSGLQVT